MDRDLKILFQKYQDGKISLPEELLLAEKLADPAHSEADHFLKADLQQSLDGAPLVEKDLTHVLHGIHHQIHLMQTARNRSKRYRLYHWSSRVAALLFFPLLVISLFLMLNDRSAQQNAAMLQVLAPKGARVNFRLPDGTTGILNGGSRLSYAAVFSETRQVILAGEAYFSVAKDKKHPFIIHVNEDEVKVVGTKFSLAAYPSDKSTELVLEEGKVLFTSPVLKSPVELMPGQRLMEKGEKVERSEVETWKYTAWKDGKLVFRNDSMEELARRISRWYNVDVEIEGQGLQEYLFRGVFEDDSLEEVLRLLKMTSPIDYEIHDRQANADGSFSRKKIILTKR